MQPSKNSAQKLLVISHDVVGSKMAGPGIRYYHLANALSQHISTTFAVPFGSTITNEGVDFSVSLYDHRNLGSLTELLKSHTICFLPSDIADNIPQTLHNELFFIIDGYDPLLMEWLSFNSHQPVKLITNGWIVLRSKLAFQHRLGDFFVCASERQRDWWLGLLEANGRINPATFAQDPSLRKLIDVVPYGVRSDLLPPPKPIVKGIWKGIDPTDHLLLWGGGLWTWLDPLTAIQAVAKIYESRQDVKLIFPGAKHPNADLSELKTHLPAAQRLAAQLGILDKAVFFGEWLPYSDWPHLLQECSIALSIHFDTVETRLAFRSRVLEYIWAGIPIISTQGDATSELIAKYSLGHIVDYEDVDGIALAIKHILEKKDNLSADFEGARQALAWERSAAPLIAFCKEPYRAADKIQDGEDESLLSRLGEIDYDLVNGLQVERNHWRTLAQGYERGKVMRILNWFNRRWQALRGE